MITLTELFSTLYPTATFSLDAYGGLWRHDQCGYWYYFDGIHPTALYCGLPALVWKKDECEAGLHRIERRQAELIVERFIYEFQLERAKKGLTDAP